MFYPYIYANFLKSVMMKSKLLVSCLLLAMLITGMRSTYGQAEVWPLEKCITYAIDNNIQVKQMELASEFNSNTLQQSKLGALPNLNAGATHSWSFGRALDETTYEFTKDQTVMSDNIYLSSSVTLFNGLQTLNTIKQSQYDLMASLQDVDKIKNDISLSIALAYLQILLNMELLEVTNNQLEITRLQITRTSQLVEAGSLAQGSLLEIQAQVAAEELQQVNAQNQLDISYLTLTQFLELDSVGNFKIEIPDLPLPEEEFLLESISEIYSDAERILPQVKSADYMLKSSEVGLNIAKGARSPRLSFTGSYGTRYSNILKQYSLVPGETSDPFPIGTVEGTGEIVNSFPQPLVIGDNYPFGNQFSDNATYGVQFNLTIPIFNGWQTNTMISNAKISVLNSKYNLESTKNILYKEIQQAFADAVASLKKYRASEKAVSSMEESFRYTEQKFNVGMVTSFDYNTAKNQLASTQSDLLQSKYEYIFTTKVLEFYRGWPLSLK